MPGLSDDEMRAIAYYAIGVGSEGKDTAYRLSFAGNHLHRKDGTVLLEPIGNSGYSVGELQTDLGQHPDDAEALVDAYQAWAKTHHPGWVLSGQQQAQYASDLGRDGHHIRDANYTADDSAYRALHHTQIPSRLLPKAGPDIDATFESRLDLYLETDSGKSFVHGLDVRQVDDLMKTVAKPLNRISFYQSASPEEQAKILAVTAKAYNQHESLGRELLAGMEHHQISSLAGIETRINAFPDGPSHYMHTGRDAALQGAKLFNALRNARDDNPLHGVWQTVSADPLANPAQIGKDASRPYTIDHYATVKGLFVQPLPGYAFVAALDRGASYNRGDPAHAGSRGLYAEGRDFLQWDHDGDGRAFINGQWSQFSRDEVSLTRNPDDTLDVALARNGQTQRLLHLTHPQLRVDAAHHAHRTTVGVLQYGTRDKSVKALQTNLARLGYTNRDGQALHADGDFGTDTLLAVKAFQHDHGLVVDGVVGPRTQQALNFAEQVAQVSTHVQNEALVTSSGFDDPAHRQHGLYAAFKQWLPQGTSEARLAQATAACYSAGMKHPEDVAGIYSGNNGKILFTTNSLFANMAEMDLSKAAPTIQQSLQRIQQFDRQQQMQTPQQVMQHQPASVVPHQ